jgi:hypothetical protein
MSKSLAVPLPGQSRTAQLPYVDNRGQKELGEMRGRVG